jgi:uncharacterized RDD family membrane protein YckC
MDRKSKRTIISIEDQNQQRLDFEEAERTLPFTFPEYQRELLRPRCIAGITDFGIAGGAYLVFLIATLAQRPSGLALDKRELAIYAVCFFAFAVVYFLLFMLSESQTPGMKLQRLVVVNRSGELLDPKHACSRGFGYLISTLPLLLGFLWMLVDPEHLSWADKVSGTYLKKI